MAVKAKDPHRTPRSPIPTALWWSGPLLVVVGISLHGLWRVAPWERFGLSIALGLIACIFAWPLAHWRRWRMASALAAVWIAALTVFVGPAAILAVALMAAAALALGLRWIGADVPARAAIAAVTGYAVITGVAGWLLQLPIHHRWIWLGLLAALILSNRRAVTGELRASRTRWAALVDASPRGAAWMVMLLGLASTGAWLPTMQADDLTHHLNLPAQLALYARYQPEPLHGAWAFAPWMGDVGHGVAWLLSGQEARGALNALWLVLSAATLGACARALGARTSERIAVIAVMASFPPLVWLMAGMQTELPAMAVLFALAALLLHTRRDTHLLGIAVLFAALAALKPIHAVSALPLIAYASRVDPGRALRRLPLLVLVALAVGGASYAQAWWQTGNPVFPLFNAFFESPYYPLEDMEDRRWLTGLRPALPWAMTFHTHRYLEAWDGGIGFLWIGGAGGLVARSLPPLDPALRRRGRMRRAASAVADAVRPLCIPRIAAVARAGAGRQPHDGRTSLRLAGTDRVPVRAESRVPGQFGLDTSFGRAQARHPRTAVAGFRSASLRCRARASRAASGRRRCAGSRDGSGPRLCRRAGRPWPRDDRACARVLGDAHVCGAGPQRSALANVVRRRRCRLDPGH